MIEAMAMTLAVTAPGETAECPVGCPSGSGGRAGRGVGSDRAQAAATPARRQRRRSADEERAATAAPATPPSSSSASSGRAGNAAVARVLAREPAADAPVQVSPFDFRKLDLARCCPSLKPEVQRAVDAYLERQSNMIQALGTPMPVLIDEVRRKVPEAAEADANAIKDRILAIVPNVPMTRAGAGLGQKKAEQEASIANAFPKPPTSVTVGNAKTYVKVEIVSAELKSSGFTVKADKEGGKAEYEKGDAKVGVSGKWDGSEFGIKTEVHGVKFGGKVHRKNDGWGWSGGLLIPLWGDEVDEVPDVGGRRRRRAHRARRVAGPPARRRLGHRRLRHRPDGSDQARDRRHRRGRGPQEQVRRDAAGHGLGRRGGFTAGVSLVIVF